MNIRKGPGYMLKLTLISITILIVWFTIIFVADSQQEKETKILASIELWDVIVIWFMGMLGGLANSLVEKEGWGLDFVYNLVLGGIAALVIYSLAGSELSPLRQVGVALLSGIGGSHIITNLKQRVFFNKAIESLTKTTGGLFEMTGSEEGGDDYELATGGTDNQAKAGNQSEG